MKGTYAHTRPLLLTALLCAVALTGCNDLIRGKIQSELDKLWGIPSRKTSTEDKIEAKLKKQIDDSLAGKYFEVPGPNPYLHHVKKVSVNLGNRPPIVDVPGKVKFWQTETNYYLQFDWEAGWTKGNGAAIDIGLDLRTKKWYLANEYPDHTVKIRKIGAEGDGKVLVIRPKTARAKAVASLSVKKASVDLEAKAKGWFWTVNISKQIKKQINDELLRRIVGKSVEYAFDANIPGI